VEQIRVLRKTIEVEQGILGDLERGFNQKSMKDWVKRVMLDVEEVETFFLSRLDDDSRTAGEEAAVIRDAEPWLQHAIAKRKKLQEAMANYGADAILIP
jgi:hypothetical protein